MVGGTARPENRETRAIVNATPALGPSYANARLAMMLSAGNAYFENCKASAVHKQPHIAVWAVEVGM